LVREHTDGQAVVEGRGEAKMSGRSPEGYDYREVASCACFHVRRAARVVTQDFDDALQPVGLKATQYTVLCALAGPWRSPPPIAALAEHLLVEPSALSRNVAGLVKRGLVKLSPGKDRRERGVSLTPAGRDLFEAGFPHWKRAQDALRARLGDEAFRGALGTLKVLSEKP
jgi:DNA-binding MarR family transcriptional regulator